MKKRIRIRIRIRIQIGMKIGMQRKIWKDEFRQISRWKGRTSIWGRDTTFEVAITAITSGKWFTVQGRPFRRYAIPPFRHRIRPTNTISTALDSIAFRIIHSFIHSSVVCELPRYAHNFNGEDTPQNLDEATVTRSHRINATVINPLSNTYVLEKTFVWVVGSGQIVRNWCDVCGKAASKTFRNIAFLCVWTVNNHSNSNIHVSRWDDFD
jgi:hypothetical protein